VLKPHKVFGQVTKHYGIPTRVYLYLVAGHETKHYPSFKYLALSTQDKQFVAKGPVHVRQVASQLIHCLFAEIMNLDPVQVVEQVKVALTP